MAPLVSVIIPVYNAENFLRETLESMIGQTYQNIEILCVDDGSTDSSPAILEEYKKKDVRIRVFRKENGGGGAARNYGLDRAAGEYLYFFDSDDVANKNLLEKAVSRALETNADLVAFNGYTFVENDLNKKTYKSGFNKNILKDVNSVFSYRDYPNSILSIVNVVPWNKIIRRDIVKKHNIRYDEISSSDDLTFSVLCAAVAERIAVVDNALMNYRLGHSGTITSTYANKLFNVKHALESTERQINALPYADQIRISLYNLILDNYCFIFTNYTFDFDTQQVKAFYEFLHTRFSDAKLGSLKRGCIRNEYTFALYESIKKHTYEEMRRIRAHDITVSLTSYPARIDYVHHVIENIAAQTLKPKRVLLWLSKQQFKNRNEDLPQSLIDCVSRGEVEIKWCNDDLRSHKKYFYTMQEYPNDIVITVDDDLIYPNTMISSLYQSYIAFPDCISGMRVHVVGLDKKKKKILDYAKWIKQFDRDILIPSKQLFATTGAGCLFPPGILDERAFNKQKLLELCPLADDIWVNLMALANGVGTVCAVRNFYLHYCAPQEDSLFWVNVNQHKNEEQYEAVRAWLERDLGTGYFYDAVSEQNDAFDLNDPLALIDYAEFLRLSKMSSDKKLNRAYAEKSELNAKLQKTYEEKAQRGKEINKLKAENLALSKKTAQFERKMRKIEKTFFFRVYRFLKRVFTR